MINNFEGDYRFLSNFFMFPVTYENIEYPSNEHAYQAAKTLLLTDKMKISKLKTPGEAKKAGRQVFLRLDWEEIKYDVMFEICKIKFSDPQLKTRLLLTGDSYLEEGNTWHDNFWGVCKCSKCGLINHKMKQNQLGQILMQIRQNLK
jgi:ribA/ribD-fused uncharacterized protein